MSYDVAQTDLVMQSVSSEIVTYQRRLIAFLDILGFSELLAERPAVDLHAAFAKLIDDARSEIFTQQTMDSKTQVNFDKAQFLFDSILLVSRPLSDSEGTVSTFNFLSAICLLFERCFERDMPLRGCIGLGDLTDDSGRGIFLSAILPMLVKSEKLYEWTGVTVREDAASEIFRQLYGSDSPTVPSGSCPLVRYAPPRKDAPGPTEWCLNWSDFCDPSPLKTALTFLIEPKRTNTEAFVDHVKDLPRLELHLPPAMEPAKTVRLRISRQVFGIKFLDSNGCGVEPGGGFKIEFSSSGLRIGPPAEPEPTSGSSHPKR